MNTIIETLQTALQYHQAGNLPQAEALYKQILQADPWNADAVHYLGVVAQQTGNFVVALDYMQKSLALAPANDGYHCDLGGLWQALGRFEEAAASYREAARLRPDSARAHNGLGNVLHAQGKLDKAADSYRRALAADPNFAEAHSNLAFTLHGQGKLQEAETHGRKAIRLKPDYPDGRNNLGNIQMALGKLDEAITNFREALRVSPNFALAHNNLGGALNKKGKLDEAVLSYREALRCRPDYADAHANLATTLKIQGKWEEAEQHVHEALRLQPGSKSALWLLALLRLVKGDFAAGWPNYEYRWAQPGFVSRHRDHPAWDGSPLDGKTIFLHAEQGFGDTIQFARYIPLVKERGGKVLFECQPELVELFSGFPGIDEITAAGTQPPKFDVQAPLLSLPGIFGTTLATLPASIPYLHAESDLVEHWRKELGMQAGFKIGISWQGSLSHPGDRFRSFPLKLFESIAQVSGTRLVSLQKGPGTEQLRSWKGPTPILDLGSRLKSFRDTAALIMNLDIIVSADTALVHLAGALGAPVWNVLPVSPDWRWLLDRPDTPWYPTMRLFRQSRLGEWGDVFERIQAEIRKKTL